MIKNRLARHLAALGIAKIIVLAAIWPTFFFRAPPIDPGTPLFAAPPVRGDRP